jgi:ribosomal protein S18 acetylase RimI-like enzyme
MISYRQPKNLAEVRAFVDIVEKNIDGGPSGGDIIPRCRKKGTILAVEDGTVVGGIAFMTHDLYEEIWGFQEDELGRAADSVAPDDLGYISYIAVADTHQGLGIGAELLKRASVRLEKAPCGALWVHVWSGSPGNASYRLFSRFGFEQVKRTKKPWVKTEHVKCVVCGEHCQCDCITMLKVL